ncbi:hypothetical protein QJS04_geneDACA015735 [Acorus gramineus]|uniref:Uncharacterized protein n=1 Tax=Acorus gramineus TaxID=55184 RepID=A0AAV9BQT4_ACOGR|nr:hypothetical protein QJS04_geneDACA015735 [Acorus gramineus]
MHNRLKKNKKKIISPFHSVILSTFGHHRDSPLASDSYMLNAYMSPSIILNPVKHHQDLIVVVRVINLCQRRIILEIVKGAWGGYVRHVIDLFHLLHQ